MKKAFFVFLLLGLIYQTGKPAGSGNSPVTGTWRCAVADVPYEYSSSLIIFTEKDGILTGTVKFDSGEEIRLTSVSLTEDKLALTLLVEGNSISVDGKIAEGKITGVVNTPDSKVNFTASRVPEKKK